MNKLYQRISMIRERMLHIYSLLLIDSIELEMVNKDLRCERFTLKMPFNTKLGLRYISIETKYFASIDKQKELLIAFKYKKDDKSLFHINVAKDEIISIFIKEDYSLTPQQIDLALLELENYLDKYYKEVVEVNSQRNKKYDEIVKYFS